MQNMKTERELKTVGFYDKSAEAWTSMHGGNEGNSYWQDEMARFHELLPTGKVLEIGSGAGKDAAALIALGYDYVGTDASKGLIEVAQKRNPGAKFVNVAVEDLNFGEEKFDGFWTAATLLHIPKDEIDEALGSIKSQLKPGLAGFISMKAGAGEREDKETSRWFAYYSQEEFREILERNGFVVAEENTRKGEKDWWICYWVKS
ncbi:hypothetical protein A2397_03635 [Candidatus Amesbacteria bacterium RIFOXYB1_FULL_44_23]|uniref:Methyltransferase domain-containing protein n=1 Tax=Candidatus Amesbacteria bacterium RIFOXYB1_FULL_44_23 TaxID=1797263 RepID=A0A1F4ZPL6_9BACT|nr:MAG: hypothetical protein A2397_03635 [Candidatus Amesbacteria bacterium RIFOXYB1_FULL_44_23]